MLAKGLSDVIVQVHEVVAGLVVVAVVAAVEILIELASEDHLLEVFAVAHVGGKLLRLPAAMAISLG
jgi:hypothetical protein